MSTPTTLHRRLELPRYDDTSRGHNHRPVWNALHGNARAHWRAKARATRQVVDDVVTLAHAAGLHRITNTTHLEVTLTWAPGRNLRADADNLWPLLKVCCDALARGPGQHGTGLHLVPDDTPTWMTKNAPVIATPTTHPRHPIGLWLDITLTTGVTRP